MQTNTTKIIDRIRIILMSADFKERHKKKKTAFIRKRVLSFVEIIVIQINRLVLSLSVELDNFLDVLDISKTYSKQAFSQARQMLSYTAFIELNDSCVQGFYENFHYKKFKNKYLLLAVDGSLCQLPESEEIASHFRRWKNQMLGKGIPMARISVLFDVLNQVVIDASFSSNSIGEPSLLKKHFQKISQLFQEKSTPYIYLMDRGYPSFEIIENIQKSKDFYVIRCKSTYRKEVI